MTELATRTTTDIAADVNREHRLVETVKHNLVAHAIKCGELLIEAKSRLEHGEWGEWMDTHCEFSDWTAQLYMRVARDAQANPGRVTDLPSLRSARHLLASEKEAKPDAPRQLPPPEPEVLTGTVVYQPREGIDQRKWDAATSKLDAIQRCLAEASDPALSDLLAVDALNEAARTARQASIEFEQLATKLRSQAA